MLPFLGADTTLEAAFADSRRPLSKFLASEWIGRSDEGRAGDAGYASANGPSRPFLTCWVRNA
jgi:hypothetical protein